MRIIFFNVWNGKIHDGMTEFIKEQSVTTDIFCFQEVFDDMKAICKKIIPDYQKVVAHREATPVNYAFSSAFYIAKGISVVKSATLLEDQPESGFVLYAQFSVKSADINICNVHGVSKPGKLDNPIRLKQSQTIIDFLKDKKGLKIIGGDFNLLPETKSIKMFEENGYKNIIKDYKIATTRNRLAWERYDTKLYYSDYIFTSPEAKIMNFSVPNLEISDHLPLILDIEL